MPVRHRTHPAPPRPCPSPSPLPPPPPVHILFATASGTAEDVAYSLADALLARHVRVLSCAPADAYPLPHLPAHAAASHVFLFVVATAGDGAVPYSMRALWRFLLRADLPAGILADLRFAVFGLGDRAYLKFNAAARKLSLRLADLGAAPLVPVGLGDDSAPGGYEEALAPWMEAVWRALGVRGGPGVSDGGGGGGGVKEARVEVRLEEQGGAALDAVGGEEGKEAAAADMWRVGEACQEQGGEFGALHEAVAVGNEVLTDARFLDDEKEVRHIRLDVSSAAPATRLRHYVPGDIVHVMPRNRVSAVDAFLELTGLDGRLVVHVRRVQSARRFGRYSLNIRTPCALRVFVSAQLDLTAAPRRSFFARLAPFAADARERDKLHELASAAGAEALMQYVHREKRTVLMVLRDFPSARPPLQQLVDMMPVLKPRAFSIASAVQAHEGEVHVCASIVRYTTPLRFARVGVVSAFFLRLQQGDVVPVFLETGTALRFHRERPAVMVGPGTGVAPMRSFVSSCGREGPSRTLFVGFRSPEGDFLYKRDWKAHLDAGRLSSLVTAFSRETTGTKTYVQDRLRERSVEVWKLISAQDGHIYVAGAAGSMPKGVRQAVVEICTQSGGLVEADAEAFVRKMEVSGRLQMECW